MTKGASDFCQKSLAGSHKAIRKLQRYTSPGNTREYPGIHGEYTGIPGNTRQGARSGLLHGNTREHTENTEKSDETALFRSEK